MSRETASAEAEPDTEVGTSVVELWRKWYDLPALAILAGFMLWVRMQSYEEFVGDDQVFFSGNDAYYHYRAVEYTVRNWPFTMVFDPWTKFPFGTSADQFGTLFDQIIATVALIVGLGDPDPYTVQVVTAVAPAVFGALVAIPVYYIGQRLGGRLGGVFGVFVLALLPGEFLRRSLVGFADHHVAEVLFQAIAVAGVMVAIGVAERELPVYEQLLDRDWEGLREPTKWSVVAGVGLALYMWTWPPGVLLVGILGLFFTVALSIDYVRGRSPEHVAFAGAVTMLTTFLLLIPAFDTFGFQTTSISLTQFVLVFGVAAGCVFMAALARVWDAQEFDDRLYPATVGGLIAVAVGAMATLAPSLFGLIRGNLERILLLAQSDETLTIAEAQSPVPQGPGVTLADQITVINRFMYTEYGFAYVTAYLALIWLGAHLYLRDYRAEDVFLILYMGFLTLMALTQQRFNYYLVIPIAAMNAWLFGRIVDAVGVPSVTDSLGDIEVYQVLTLLVLLLVVVGPVVQPLAAADLREANDENKPIDVLAAGKAPPTGYASPSGETWASTTGWMQNNTPEVGNYGGAGNADQIEYYGTYPRSADHEYPEGAYGVLSWWDYGHWITVQAERPAVANPFQQNPRAASAFFQAQNETKAELIVETLPTMEGRTEEYDDLSEEELREIEADMDDQRTAEDTRYVVIDNETATRKWPAVTQWSGPASRDGVGFRDVYTRGQAYQLQNGQNVTVTTYNDRYRNTMLFKLYYQDAQGLSHYRLVHERDSYSLVGGLSNGRDSVPLAERRFGRWSEDTANVTQQLAGSRLLNRPIQLGGGLFAYNAHVESTLKTYERVPGSTVTGTVEGAEEGTPVTIRLELETNTGRTFIYGKQTTTDADGNFEVTVSYATNDEVGPDEGGTDSAVEATGDYEVLVGGAGPGGPSVAKTFEVPETAIYEGETVDVGTVEPPAPDEGGDNESSPSLDSDSTDDAGSATPAVTAPDSTDDAATIVAPATTETPVAVAEPAR